MSEGGLPESRVPDAARPRPTGSWEDISLESLHRSALFEEAHGVIGTSDAPIDRGRAWFQVVLGVLLGMAATLGMYEWSRGALGPFVALPAVVVGLPLALLRRADARQIGFGLLVSIPVAAGLGTAIWYATLFV